MKPKLIIFDFSGTLAHFKKSDQKEFFSGMAKLGIEIKTEEEVKSFNNLFWQLMSQAEDLKDFSGKILNYFSIKKDEKIIKKAADFFQEFISFDLFEDAKEIIDLPVKKAILSSASDFLIRQALPREFEIFGSKKNKFHKPDPRAFLTVLEILEVNPEDAVMVGDEAERDLVPAQKLGMKTVFIDRNNEIKNYSGIKISSLKEIKNIFDF
ncbi:MAG: HAD family hydrolase [Candidatus Nealsonbacteria bacterium]|nr:HAD family hydrolase [Candidatus Nealsonbacteria bacterium]